MQKTIVRGLCPALLLALLACGGTTTSYMRRADEFYRGQKYKDAALNYRRAIRSDPQLIDAHYGLALTELKLNEPKRAFTSLQRALTLSPGRRDIVATLADTTLTAYLLDQRHPPQLEALLVRLSDDLLKIDPSSAPGLRVKGYLHLVKGDLRTATEFFTRANAAAPDDPQVVTILSQVLLHTGNVPQAEKLALGLIARKPEFPVIYDVLYRQYMAEQRFADAERILRMKISAQPAEVDYVLQLAGFYAERQRTAEMLALVDRVSRDHDKFADAHLKTGDFLARIEMPDRALAAYREGARLDRPNEVTYRKREAQTLAATGEREKAIAVLESAAKLDPDDAELAEARAGLLLSSGARRDAGIEILKSLAEREPGRANTRFLLGNAYLQRRDYPRARKAYEEALGRDPANAQAFVGLIQASQSEEEFRSALTFGDHILRLDPGNSRVRLARVEALLRIRRFQEAHSEIAFVLRQQPNNREATLQRGRVYLAEQKFQNAENILRPLTDAANPDPRVLEALARAAVGQKQPDRAIQLWKQHVDRFPESLAFREGLARSAFECGQYDVAIAEYSRLLARTPDIGDLHARLGEAYFAAGRIAEAMQSFRMAAQAGGSAGSYAASMVGYLQHISGDAVAAEANYRQILKNDPSDEYAMNNLAYILAQRGGNLDEAYALATEAVRRQPGHSAFSDTLGFVYLKKGNIDGAFRVFDNLVRQHPREPNFREHLGLALLAKGDPAGARRELQAALAASSPARQDQIRRTLSRIP